MAEDKRDYLGLCNENKLPFQEFMAGWCSRCFQAECSRSLHGKSKFEVRAMTWEDTLFKNISKLSPEDERFQQITSRRFLNVMPTQPGKASAWMDPREVETHREISIPKPVGFQAQAPEPVTPPSPQIVEKPVETPPPVPELVAAVTPPPAPAPPPAAPQGEPLIRNTPVRSRQMIGPAEQKGPAPVLDPWQPKQPLRPGETLVQPGSRIKLGGGS